MQGCWAKAKWYATQTASNLLGAGHVIVTVTTNAALDRTLTVPVFQIGLPPPLERGAHPRRWQGHQRRARAQDPRGPGRRDGPRGRANRDAHHRGAHLRGDPQRLRADLRRVAHVDRRRRSDGRHAHRDQRVGARGDARSSSRCSSEKLHYLSRGADFVVLSGSLPRKVPTTFYADAVRDLAPSRRPRRARHAKASRSASRVEAGPFLVSPNQREAEQLVGQELEDDDDFLMALDAIAEMGPRNVLITLENGCFALLRVGRKTRRDPRVRAARRAGVRRRLGRRAPRAVPRRDRRRARRPTTRSALRLPPGAASVREVGAGRFDPAFAATLAADIELAELQPVRS